MACNQHSIFSMVLCVWCMYVSVYVCTCVLQSIACKQTCIWQLIGNWKLFKSIDVASNTEWSQAAISANTFKYKHTHTRCTVLAIYNQLTYYIIFGCKYINFCALKKHKITNNLRGLSGAPRNVANAEEIYTQLYIYVSMCPL